MLNTHGGCVKRKSFVLLQSRHAGIQQTAGSCWQEVSLILHIYHGFILQSGLFPFIPTNNYWRNSIKLPKPFCITALLLKWLVLIIEYFSTACLEKTCRMLWQLKLVGQCRLIGKIQYISQFCGIDKSCLLIALHLITYCNACTWKMVIGLLLCRTLSLL